MSRVFDLEAELRRIKANEHFIAFAAWTAELEGRKAPVDGVVKVAGRTRSDGESGFLTLSFLVDVAQDAQLRKGLSTLFTVDEEALRPYLGKYFDYLVETETGGVGEGGDWYMKDVTFFFTHVQGRVVHLVKNRIVHALSTVLSLQFDEIQWWEEEPNLSVAEEESGNRVETFLKSFTSFVRDKLNL